MIGRKVRSPWGETGTAVRWEPLSPAMCDVLVRHGDGQEVWHASHTLRPTDGFGQLPSRAEARKVARNKARSQLRAIRAQHVRDFNEPWPGAEFAKTIIGRAIDGALADLDQQ